MVFAAQKLVENRGLILFVLLSGLTLLLSVLALLSSPSTGVQSRVDSGYRMGRPLDEQRLFEIADRAVERSVLKDEDSPEAAGAETLASAPELKLAPGVSQALQRDAARVPRVSGINPHSVPLAIPMAIPTDQLPPNELGDSTANNPGQERDGADSSKFSPGVRGTPPVLSQAGSTKSARDRNSAPRGGKASISEPPPFDLAEAYRNSWLSPEQIVVRLVDALNVQDAQAQLSARQLLTTMLDEQLLQALTDFQGKNPQPRLEFALMSLVEEGRIPLMARILSRTSGQGRSLVLLSMLQKLVDQMRESQRNLDSLKVFRPSLLRMKSASFRPAISARASDLLDQLGPERTAFEKDSPSN